MTVTSQLHSRSGQAPFGKRIVVRSDLTGAVLDHFVPFPVEDVVAKIQLSQEDFQFPSGIEEALPVIGLLVSKGEASGEFDPSYLYLCSRIAAGSLSFHSKSDLLALGCKIDQSNKGLRQQIAYGGGRTPSLAEVIYPPASELPSLIESMGLFLGTELSDWNPGDLATMICEYSVRVHPFGDGNGRWARLLALDAGRRAGSLWAGAAAALLNKQQTIYEVGRENFVNTTSMEPVLIFSREFRKELHSHIEKTGAGIMAAKFWGLAQEYADSATEAVQLALEAFVVPDADFQQQGQKYRWSEKKRKGFASAFRNARGVLGSDGSSNSVNNDLSTRVGQTLQSILRAFSKCSITSK